MIEVDIIGQLVPNPLTMIVQLCSTLVLFLLAKKFLWTSVQGFLGKRADKMQEDLNLTEEAKQEAMKDLEEAKTQLSAASVKSEEIVNAAVKEAKVERDAIMAQAAKDAENVRKKAHEQIEAERREMYSDLQKEMIEVAISAAGKLIGDQNGEELDRKAVDAFVKEATGNE